MSNKRAINLWKRHKYEDSLRCFKAAANKKNANLNALLDYAYALERCYHWKQADAVYQRILGFTQADQAIRLISDRLLHLKRLDRAIPFLEILMSRKSIKSTESLHLINAYDQSGRLEEAMDLLERLLKSSRPSAALTNIQGRFKERESNLEEALSIFQASRKINGDSAEERKSSLFGEARCLEKLGNYQAAMDSIQSAKEIDLANPKVPELYAHSLSLINQFLNKLKSMSPEHLKNIQQAATHSSQDSSRIALMAGFPRSGTTLLEQVLSSHPKVITADETHVFATRINPQLPLGDDQLKTSEQKKLQHFYYLCMEESIGSTRNKMLIDKNPSMIPAVPNFLRVFPSAKLILCLRDPRDVMLSCYSLGISINPVSVHFLRWDWCWEYYRKNMEMLLLVKEKFPWMCTEVRYEELVEDFELSSAKTIRDLGLEYDGSVTNYRNSAGKGKFINSPTYADARRPIYRNAVNRWEKFADQLKDTKLPLDDPLYKKLGY